MSRTTQNNVVWGLEFGGSALRMVRLTRSGSQYHAEKFIQASLDDRWEKPADTAAALERMAAEKLAEPLVVCGADELVLFRSVCLPQADAGALAKMVRAQLEVLIPAQAEQFATGLSSTPDPYEPGGQRVLSYALRRSVLSEMLEDCKCLGRRADGLVPSILALAAIWTHLAEDSKTPLLLLDLGARCTSMALIDGPDLIRCALLDQGADHWTERIAEELNLSYSQAEQRKLAYAGSSSPADADRELARSLHSALTDWSGQLREAYRHCLADIPPQRHPARGIIFGRSAGTPGLDSLIAQTLELKLTQPSTPKRLTLAPGIDFAQSAPAIGAALCAMQPDWATLNLADSFPEKPSLAKVFSFKWAVLLVWVLAAVLALYGFDRLEASKLQDILQQVRTKTSQQGGVARQLAIGKYLEASGPGPLAVLDRITEILPQEVMISTWRYSRAGELTMAGTVPNEKEFLAMWEKLSEFGRVEPKSSKPEKGKFRFEIKLLLARSFKPSPAESSAESAEKPEKRKSEDPADQSSKPAPDLDEAAKKIPPAKEQQGGRS